jgi:serine/threonine protein kinase/tetratricopeptide (TPR) repeat protein
MAGEADRPGTSAVETIFLAALELPAAERPAYLAAACGDDWQLRKRVEELLQANEAPEGFLPVEHGTAPGEAPLPATGQSAALTERPGDCIGRYKLLKKLGEGGCGVVYLAEQEVPVRRKVALKVIKLGMDTRSVIARFEAERQALALMDHSNIAKVLDAGATDTGRPYFVMELVSGIKITDYCEQNQLDMRQRLDLFIQVCRAIQHAHQKGVIHRDIKPSNVLVATQDHVPVPKVIDFGIAKATQGKLTDQTVFTALEQFMGTPAYMSPEQAELGAVDIDTRSDIYSLGVLLYELLTGKTPFDSRELVAAGLVAMRRTIQEKEPPTPSARLKLELTARNVQSPGDSTIKNPQSKIENDLDWIVMKCLEKDRSRRYETANGVAMDIERHLKNEPVVARPPSKLYEFQKTVRRHKFGFAAVATVVIALVAGALVSTLQAVRATRAERKSAQVAQFMKDMLKGVAPSKALGRDTTMLKEILDKTAERLGKELTNQPEVELEMRDVLAWTYMDLGLFKPMEQMAQQSLRVSRARFGERSPETARALTRLGVAQRRVSHFDQAEESLREAFKLQRELGERGCRDMPYTSLELGFALGLRGNAVEAERIEREGLSMARKVFGRTSEEVAGLLESLGGSLCAQQRWDEGHANQREALGLFRKLFGEQHPWIAITLNDLGFTLARQGRLGEAETELRDALAMRRRILGNDHDMTADSMVILSWVLVDQVDRAKLHEAETLARGSYAIKKKAIGHSADHLGNLLMVLQVEGKHSEVVALCREELPGLRIAVSSSEEDELAWVLAEFADSLNALGSFKEAEPLARDAVAILEKDASANWHRFYAQSVLGTSLLGKQQFTIAEPWLLCGYQGMSERLRQKPLLGYYLKKLSRQLMQLYEATDRPDQATQWKKALETLDRAETTSEIGPTHNLK